MNEDTKFGAGGKRKSHRKSRNGCLQCKRRHRKCDEQRPQCGGCQKHGTTCTFSESCSLSETPQPSISDTPSTSHASPPQSDSDVLATTSNQTVNMMDIELYDDYILNRCLEFIPGTAQTQMEMLRAFTKMLLARPYLLHSAMAVSAIRLFYDNPMRRDLLPRGAHLQNVAINQARPLMASLTIDHSIAMLFFSSTTASYALAEGALSCRSRSTMGGSALQKLMDCFKLANGIRTVLSPHWDQLPATWIKPLLDFNLNDPQRKVVRGTHDHPDYRMVRNLAFTIPDAERKGACLKMLDEIFDFLVTLQHDQSPQMRTFLVLNWGARISPVFTSMVQQRNLAALLIMAQYAILLKRSRMWWVSKWPRLICDEITACMDEDWSEFLQGPRHEIYTDD